MSPRVPWILVASTLLVVCVLTDAADSFSRTFHLTRRNCMTQKLEKEWVWRIWREPCLGTRASIYSRWRRRRPHSRNWCIHPEKVLVPRVISFIHCCPGWTTNFRGRCKIRVPMADCNGGCENNGTCNAARDTCSCSPGFTGKRCEQALCTPGCENGGMCDAVSGTSVCNCPRAFRGPTCEEAVCEDGCENGGTCSAIGTKAMCLCARGFVGKRCEHALKEGECPIGTRVRHPNCSVEARCEFDYQCPGHEKCCYSASCTSRICHEPAPRGCPFGNEVIDVGKKFRPEPCKVCTCLSPDRGEPYGGAICTNITCPAIPPGFRRCKREVRGDNQCCKICKEPEIQKPSNITAPVFKNCPTDGIIVDLPKTGRTAQVPQDLEATDMLGQKLEVQYSNLSLTWNSDIDRNFHLILATAADQWEQIVECSFVVRIRDPHPPVFINCPTEVLPVQGSTVTWNPPIAKDNTVLEGPPESDFIPGQASPGGRILVTYTAEDLEGNEGLCQFFVTVLPPTKSTVSPTVADGDAMRSGQEEKHPTDFKIFIYIGLGTVALLVLLGVSLFCFLGRRRRSLDTVAYPCKDEAPPPYTAVVKKSVQNSYENTTVLKSPAVFDNPVYSNTHAYQQQNSENQVTDTVR